MIGLRRRIRSVSFSRFDHVLKRFSLCDGMTAVQVALGLGMLGVGIILLGRGETFRISESYSWFRKVIAEQDAGLVLIFSGFVTLVTPALQSEAVNVMVAFMLGSLCGMIAIGFYFGSALSIGTVVFLSPFAFLSYWLMFKRLFK